ncbi:hypothetical protein K2X33_01435 [bacterium]|nr:hypothetical protein [bacterium]
MANTTKFFALLTTLVLTACGRFDFGTQAAIQSLVAEARYLSVENSAGLGLGSCSSVEIKGWAEQGVPGSPRRAQTIQLAGLGANDKVFADDDCTQAIDPKTLVLKPGQTSIHVYVQAATVGARTLQAVSDKYETAAAATSVNLAVTSIRFSQNSFVADAGFCSGPVQFNFKDANGNSFAPSSQDIVIEGADGLLFDGPGCSNALPRTQKISGAYGGAFYVRKNQVDLSSISVKVSDPSKPFIAAVPVALQFRAVPQQVAWTVPSSDLTLGVCEAQAFQVELRDVDGSLVSPPTGSSVSVQLGGASGALFNYRTACGVMGTIISNVVFSPGQSSKLVYVEPRNSGTPAVRAWVAGSLIAEANRSVNVVRKPLAVTFTGPLSVTAGSLSTAYTVTLLDGVGAALGMPSGADIKIDGALAGQGTVCSQAPCASNPLAGNTLHLGNNVSSGTFYFQPNLNATAGTYALNASPQIAGVLNGSLNVGIAPRVPKNLRLSGGASSVDLGVCQSVPYVIDLLDANGIAVNAQSALTVSLDFSAGSGEYRLGGCDQATASSVVFAAGVGSKTVYIKATARGSVTLKVSSTSLSSGDASMQVSVVTKAAALTLVGPSTVTAGKPSAVYTLRQVDGLGDPFPASSAVQADIAISDAQARMVYCSTANCSATTATLRASIASGQSSATFWVLSDAELPLSTLSLTATPVSGTLQAASMLVSFNRTSLSLDDGSAFLGNLALPGNNEVGAIQASRYANGKLTVVGYSNGSGQNKFSMARYSASRSLGSAVLDTSFSSNGYRVDSVGDNAKGVALVPQGENFLVLGSTSSTNIDGSTDVDFFLGRILANGSVDSTFRNGLQPVVLPGEQIPTALLVGSDGTIYVVGHADPLTPSDTDTRDIFVAAFRSNGDAVADGLRYYDSGAARPDYAYAATLQPLDGRDRIVIGGSTGISSQDALVLRVFGISSISAQSLIVDTSFGSSGFLVRDFGSSANDIVYALALDPISGRVIAAGGRDGSSSRGVLLGLSGSNGALDPAFGTSGMALQDVTSSTSKSFYSLAIDNRTGAIYAAGKVDSDILVARFANNGRADGLAAQSARLGIAGGAADVARSLVLGEDYKPIVLGYANGQWAGFQLLR